MPIYCKMLIKHYSDRFVGADSSAIYASFLKPQYDLKQIQACYFCFCFNLGVKELLLP